MARIAQRPGHRLCRTRSCTIPMKKAGQARPLSMGEAAGLTARTLPRVGLPAPSVPPGVTAGLRRAILSSGMPAATSAAFRASARALTTSALTAAPPVSSWWPEIQHDAGAVFLQQPPTLATSSAASSSSDLPESKYSLTGASPISAVPVLRRRPRQPAAQARLASHINGEADHQTNHTRAVMPNRMPSARFWLSSCCIGKSFLNHMEIVSRGNYGHLFTEAIQKAACHGKIRSSVSTGPLPGPASSSTACASQSPNSIKICPNSRFV